MEIVRGHKGTHQSSLGCRVAKRVCKWDSEHERIATHELLNSVRTDLPSDPRLHPEFFHKEVVAECCLIDHVNIVRGRLIVPVYRRTSACKGQT